LLYDTKETETKIQGVYYRNLIKIESLSDMNEIRNIQTQFYFSIFSNQNFEYISKPTSEKVSLEFHTKGLQDYPKFDAQH